MYRDYIYGKSLSKEYVFENPIFLSDQKINKYAIISDHSLANYSVGSFYTKTKLYRLLGIQGSIGKISNYLIHKSNINNASFYMMGGANLNEFDFIYYIYTTLKAENLKALFLSGEIYNFNFDSNLSEQENKVLDKIYADIALKHPQLKKLINELRRVWNINIKNSKKFEVLKTENNSSIILKKILYRFLEPINNKAISNLIDYQTKKITDNESNYFHEFPFVLRPDRNRELKVTEGIKLWTLFISNWLKAEKIDLFFIFPPDFTYDKSQIIYKNWPQFVSKIKNILNKNRQEVIDLKFSENFESTDFIVEEDADVKVGSLFNIVGKIKIAEEIHKKTFHFETKYNSIIHNLNKDVDSKITYLSWQDFKNNYKSKLFYKWLTSPKGYKSDKLTLDYISINGMFNDNIFPRLERYQERKIFEGKKDYFLD